MPLNILHSQDIDSAELWPELRHPDTHWGALQLRMLSQRISHRLRHLLFSRVIDFG
ncbi:MAG: Uncharacterised protein [Halieaceae bacterium]|nr:MAG: Uncharacterised protein [Halieaceae bacterium]